MKKIQTDVPPLTYKRNLTIDTNKNFFQKQQQVTELYSNFNHILSKLLYLNIRMRDEQKIRK